MIIILILTILYYMAVQFLSEWCDTFSYVHNTIDLGGCWMWQSWFSQEFLGRYEIPREIITAPSCELDPLRFQSLKIQVPPSTIKAAVYIHEHGHVIIQLYHTNKKEMKFERQRYRHWSKYKGNRKKKKRRKLNLNVFIHFGYSQKVLSILMYTHLL